MGRAPGLRPRTGESSIPGREKAALRSNGPASRLAALPAGRTAPNRLAGRAGTDA